MAWPGAGRASFQWHPSRAHLVQRTVLDVPGAPDSISGCWEKAENGPEFTVDFYLTYRKVT